MDDQSVHNVLNILRLLKGCPTAVSALTAIEQWCGPDLSDLTVLKFAAYVVEEARLAEAVIENSQLSDEAKAGVLATIRGVSTAFSLAQIQTQWSSHIRDISAAVSNIVILLSALGVPTDNKKPIEVDELLKDVEGMLAAFEDSALDPVVREVARRHLTVLATLLRHLPVFGLEPALTTYFELTMKLRRCDIGTSEVSHSKLAALFVTMRTWGERLAVLDKLWNSGAKLIEHAGAAKEMLTYVPKP